VYLYVNDDDERKKSGPEDSLPRFLHLVLGTFFPFQSQGRQELELEYF
jgi:hypothetical protein